MERKQCFAWVLNLDAEFELATPGYTPKTELLEQLARHGAASRALLGRGDVLIAYSARAPGRASSGSGERVGALSRAAGSALSAAVVLPGEIVGRAWCPTPRALALLEAHGAPPEPHPPPEVLRRVNHRRFACELGGGLPEQHYVEERASLEALLGGGRRAWLLKRPLAFAGRGQLRAFRELSAKEWSWVDASLERDGLVVEPFVEPSLEVSLHGFLWPDGRHELGRPCVQEVSSRGVFRGVRIAEPGELEKSEERAVSESAERVASALAGAGYFGPFGVDAYRYRAQPGHLALGGHYAFCALGEINARYSMGFATGFPRPASELRLD